LGGKYTTCGPRSLQAVWMAHWMKKSSKPYPVFAEN
jgi:hypothetical protein